MSEMNIHADYSHLENNQVLVHRLLTKYEADMVFMKTHQNIKNIVIKKQKSKSGYSSVLHIGKYMYMYAETSTRCESR